MSGWRVMAQELYEAGGSLPRTSADGFRSDLKRLRELGLAEASGFKRDDVWRLTPLGVDYCEGRVKPHGRRGGIKFHATWLASLPRAQ